MLSNKQTDIDAAVDAAGRESLIENGYVRTTVAGVARAATVSRPTFYARYSTIEDMTSNLLTQELLPLGARLNPLPTTVEGLVDALISGANDLRKDELIVAVVAHDAELLFRWERAS